MDTGAGTVHCLQKCEPNETQSLNDGVRAELMGVGTHACTCGLYKPANPYGWYGLHLHTRYLELTTVRSLHVSVTGCSTYAARSVALLPGFCKQTKKGGSCKIILGTLHAILDKITADFVQHGNLASVQTRTMSKTSDGSSVCNR